MLWEADEVSVDLTGDVSLKGELRQDRDSVAGLPGPVRIVAAPRRHGTAVAVVAASLAGRDDAVAGLARELALALPLVLVAAAGGAYLLTAAALRPVERMRCVPPRSRPSTRTRVFPCHPPVMRSLGLAIPSTTCSLACTPHWLGSGSSPPMPATNCALR
jgi:hypothetical protein